MLDAPTDVLATPDLLQRVMAVWQGREEREPLRLGPGREEMRKQLEGAAA